MTVFWSIIAWAVMLPLLPIMYFMQKNECKPKKNIIVGVTLTRPPPQRPGAQD